MWRTTLVEVCALSVAAFYQTTLLRSKFVTRRNYFRLEDYRERPLWVESGRSFQLRYLGRLECERLTTLRC